MPININIDLFGLIMPYLFGFFFIRGGLRGVKRWPDYVNGIVVNRSTFTNAIFFGTLIGMGGSTFFAYRICAKVLGGHIGSTMTSYLSFIAPALVISATAFYFYRYWESYVPDRPSEDMAKIGSGNAEALYDRGWKLVHKGKYLEAIECFDNILKNDPNSQYAWYLKGRSFFKQDKYSEALLCYDKAIKIDPNYINAWAEKGLALEKLGKVWEADECFNKARELGKK